jgi:hypothetical protein
MRIGLMMVVKAREFVALKIAAHRMVSVAMVAVLEAGEEGEP